MTRETLYDAIQKAEKGRSIRDWQPTLDALKTSTNGPQRERIPQTHPPIIQSRIPRKTRIEKIRDLEKYVDTLDGQAEAYDKQAKDLRDKGQERRKEASETRCQAAGLIVAELDSGTSNGDLAEQIGKSGSHVTQMKKAWTLYQNDRGKKRSFDSYYQEAKRPARATPKVVKTKHVDPDPQARITEMFNIAMAALESITDGDLARVSTDLETWEVRIEAFRARINAARTGNL
jgi:hypothetical protein